MNTLNRIKQYIDFKGVNIRQFEIKVGFSNGAFASQLKNNKTIGVDKIENILNCYPDLNPEWLLTGEGSMLKTNEPPTADSQCQLCQEKERTIVAQEKTIAMLEDKIQQMQKNKP